MVDNEQETSIYFYVDYGMFIRISTPEKPSSVNNIPTGGSHDRKSLYISVYNGAKLQTQLTAYFTSAGIMNKIVFCLYTEFKLTVLSP